MPKNNIKTRSEIRGGEQWGKDWLRLGAGNWSCGSLTCLSSPWLWQSLFPVLHSPLSLYLASSLSCILPTWETRGSLKHTKISILSFLPNRQHVPPHRLKFNLLQQQLCAFERLRWALTLPNLFFPPDIQTHWIVVSVSVSLAFHS